MVEEGLNPEVVIHPKSLELLSQREVGEDHIMNLGRNKSVFHQKETRFVMITYVQMGSHLQTSLEAA